MAKTSIVTPSGSKVDIDGTPEEIAAILATMNLGAPGAPPKPAPTTTTTRKKTAKRAPKKPRVTPAGTSDQGGNAGISATDIADIVNKVKTCDEAEDIEKNILDKSSQVNRTLLPLYVVHEYLDNKFGLTSGDISRVTTQLSIPISTANASSTLSGTASRYVMADGVRQRGRAAVRYKLVRRGQQYLKAVITGKSGEDKG
jgi:hypothetical protein